MPVLMKVLDEAQILARICKSERNLHESNENIHIYISNKYI